MLFDNLNKVDPEIDNLIKKETEKQKNGLGLIAGENYVSVSVLQAYSSVLTNKYSEGQIGNRYYGGNEIIDQIEMLCKKRALKLFKLDPEVWDVNVQILSGTCANFAVYTALVGKDGKIMGLDLPSGGHFSHGYQTAKKKISSSSIFFNSKSYKCNENYEINYDDLKKDVQSFKPDLLICGTSAYPGDFDYKKFREIAGDAYLMMDMSHISGLVACGLMNNPFEYCDVVTTSTQKILRGPRSAMIFYKKKVNKGGQTVDVKSLIDYAVFPSLQGGPHNQKIGALAVALKQASTSKFKTYIKNVHKNAQIMVEKLTEMGYKIASGGTKSHLILIILEGIGGCEVQRACELANIYVNKNCTLTDKSLKYPIGIRLGTAALTTRGLKKNDLIAVCQFLDQAIKIAKEVASNCISKETGHVDLNLFEKKIVKNRHIKSLKNRVGKFAGEFAFPFIDYNK